MDVVIVFEEGERFRVALVRNIHDESNVKYHLFVPSFIDALSSRGFAQAMAAMYGVEWMTHKIKTNRRD